MGYWAAKNNVKYTLPSLLAKNTSQVQKLSFPSLSQGIVCSDFFKTFENLNIAKGTLSVSLCVSAYLPMIYPSITHFLSLHLSMESQSHYRHCQ